MPVLNIGGREVTVDESFLKLSPDEQNATVDEIASSLVTKPSTFSKEGAADIAKSLGVGAAEGAIGLVGLPTDARSLSDSVGGWLAGKLTGDPEGIAKARAALANTNVAKYAPTLPGSTTLKKGIEEHTGEFYKPQTVGGEYARTLGQFLPASFIPGGGGGIGAGFLKNTVIPAAASETAGQATKGTAAEPYARLAGAVAGSVVPSILGRAVTPLPISAERQGLINTLNQEGIGLTAGQTTGSKGLRWMESQLGNLPLSGGRSAATMDRQGEQFTQAVLARAGENATRATPEVIDNAFRRIGADFDGLAARNTLMGDAHLGNDLVNIERQYMSVTPPSARAPIVSTTIREVGDAIAANQGTLHGEAYQALSSRLAAAARKTNDPQLKEAVSGVRNALDAAMERSIAATNPADLGAWREARNQYRNMLVIEKAATGAGENAAQGLISPSHLRNAVVGQSRRGYARGQGDFADLARAGEAIMKPLPDSGTAARAYAQGFPAMLGAVGGGAGLAGAPGALAGLGAVVAPPIAGRALMSGPVQAYLRNQLLSNQLRNLSPTAGGMLMNMLSAVRP